MIAREETWSTWMRAARGGDRRAYEQLLAAIAAMIRPRVRARLTGYGFGVSDTEDVVQEVLLAIHAKRHTWDEGRMIMPWISAIVRHKAIDAARRLGRERRLHMDTPVEDWADVLHETSPDPDRHLADAKRALASLSPREGGVIQAVTIDGVSVREAAQCMDLSEGAVRVALHRGLRRLAALAGAGSRMRSSGM